MNKKILIVEDNPDSREILGLFITKLGHQVIKASNSKEAIVCAEAEGPDLIFMDMNLPDADGVKTTAKLKQNPKASHSRRRADGVDVRTLARKGLESRHRRLSTKTGLTPRVKANDREIHQGIV